MSTSEYIVKPLVDQLVNDIVLRHERKLREAKKLDPTGKTLWKVAIEFLHDNSRPKTKCEFATTGPCFHWCREPIQVSGWVLHQVISKRENAWGAYKTLSANVELQSGWNAQNYATKHTSSNAKNQNSVAGEKGYSFWVWGWQFFYFIR